MFDFAVIVLRWMQLMGAMILFGSSLFFLYALPATGSGSAGELRWPRTLLAASAAAVLTGCLLGFLAQTVVLAGTVEDALQPDALSAAATGMSFGISSIVRAVAAGLFVVALAILKPGPWVLRLAAVVGGVFCASFAWMGHGAATQGPLGFLHAAGDIVHTLAAGVWIGALVVFLVLILTNKRQPPEARYVLHAALRGFSGVGSGLVAVLIVTGLINSWFVVGLPALPALLSTPYGRLLTLKLILFLGMLSLAAANRFMLTPQLGQSLREGSPTAPALAALRGSVVLETGLSVVVIALVAWFGTLAPPSGG